MPQPSSLLRHNRCDKKRRPSSRPCRLHGALQHFNNKPLRLCRRRCQPLGDDKGTEGDLAVVPSRLKREFLPAVAWCQPPSISRQAVNANYPPVSVVDVFVTNKWGKKQDNEGNTNAQAPFQYANLAFKVCFFFLKLHHASLPL